MAPLPKKRATVKAIAHPAIDEFEKVNFYRPFFKPSELEAVGKGLLGKKVKVEHGVDEFGNVTQDVGTITKYWVDEKGLWTEFELEVDTPAGKDIKYKIKNGLMREVSFGAITAEYKNDAGVVANIGFRMQEMSIVKKGGVDGSKIKEYQELELNPEGTDYTITHKEIYNSLQKQNLRQKETMEQVNAAQTPPYDVSRPIPTSSEQAMGKEIPATTPAPPAAAAAAAPPAAAVAPATTTSAMPPMEFLQQEQKRVKLLEETLSAEKRLQELINKAAGLDAQVKAQEDAMTVAAAKTKQLEEEAALRTKNAAELELTKQSLVDFEAKVYAKDAAGNYLNADQVKKYEEDRFRLLEESVLEKPLSVTSGQILTAAVHASKNAQRGFQESAILEKDRLQRESNERAYKLEQDAKKAEARAKELEDARKVDAVNTINPIKQSSYMNIVYGAPPAQQSTTSGGGQAAASKPLDPDAPVLIAGRITEGSVTASALKRTYNNDFPELQQFAALFPDVYTKVMNQSIVKECDYSIQFTKGQQELMAKNFAKLTVKAT